MRALEYIFVRNLAQSEFEQLGEQQRRELVDLMRQEKMEAIRG
jgi:hypothetical protein